jgi:hypothetical protein
VKLTNPKYKKYRIRTRSGYRPIPARVAVDAAEPQQAAEPPQPRQPQQQ